MKISVVGSGMIAKEVMTLLTSEFPQIEVDSLFVRPSSLDKGKQLAEQFGVSRVYTDYDELLAHKVDFVYVANVNKVHYEYARKALLAGQNVILEKPLCSTYSQAEELFRLALEKGLYLFEAVSLLFMPNFEAIRQNLPRIGTVHIVECNYSQYSSRYDRYLNHDVAPAFDPACDGGALRDLNVYNLNLVAGLFGKPERAEYWANRGFNGVDTSGTVMMKYPTFVASCTGAKDCGAPSTSIIQGEKGWIKVEGPNNSFEAIRICVNGQEEVIRSNCYKHRLGHEFAAIADIYAKQDYVEMKRHMAISLTVMGILDQVSASIK
ncbi:MAG: Gfo/Idh/MocA family oxidoreductase [Bacteroidaceae bacterium]|nr:Gfo/Idh/MocA family oxidoreductase [Bacteroidaceae bacterium]